MKRILSIAMAGLVLYSAAGLNIVLGDCPPDGCPRPPSGPCIPTYSMASCDDLRGPTFNCKLIKKSFWDVTFPNGPSFRPREVTGEGSTRISTVCLQPHCWPLFYCPEAFEGFWVQPVERQSFYHNRYGRQYLRPGTKKGGFYDNCCLYR